MEEHTEPRKRILSPLAIAGFTMALLAGLVEIAAGLGIRWEWWDYREDLFILRLAAYSRIVENPPQFVALLPVRQASPNKAAYSGPEIAAKQRGAYPDIVHLELSLPPGSTLTLAVNAARSLGWQVIEANEKEGRAEATDTTFRFGFKDDIVVRITPATGGSRIDVRSVPRVGKSDLGTNAKRIRGYLMKIQELGNDPTAA